MEKIMGLIEFCLESFRFQGAWVTMKLKSSQMAKQYLGNLNLSKEELKKICYFYFLAMEHMRNLVMTKFRVFS
jgi:hypothetical protein